MSGSVYGRAANTRTNAQQQQGPSSSSSDEDEPFRRHRAKKPATDEERKLKLLLGEPAVTERSITAAGLAFHKASNACLNEIRQYEISQLGETKFLAELFTMHSAGTSHLVGVYREGIQRLAGRVGVLRDGLKEAETKVKEAEAKMREAEAQAAVGADDIMCRICRVEPRDAVVMQCRHGSYCYGCLIKLHSTGKPCPSCGSPIHKVLNYHLT